MTIFKINIVLFTFLIFFLSVIQFFFVNNFYFFLVFEFLLIFCYKYLTLNLRRLYSIEHIRWVSLFFFLFVYVYTVLLTNVFLINIHETEISAHCSLQSTVKYIHFHVHGWILSEY